jgi:diguanylate cyclase (GGDEF)-like protein
MNSNDFPALASLTDEQRAAWDAMRNELHSMHMQVSELEKRLQNVEHKDEPEQALLLTRPEFNREVARMLAFDERYGGQSSVIYLDFENLDDIAQRCGRSIAFSAIRHLSDKLVSQVRGSDIVGRLGPDEFGILLIRCSNENAWKKAKELTSYLMENLVTIDGHQIHPQISYGAYTFQEDNKDVAAGLKEASDAVTKSPGGK